LRGAKESARRLDTAKKALTEMGGNVTAFYLTIGQYDMVAV